MSALLRECRARGDRGRIRGGCGCYTTEPIKERIRKSARTLAEMAWAKPALLSPGPASQPGSATGSEPGAGRGICWWEARTKLINGVRCLVKKRGRAGAGLRQRAVSPKQADLHLPRKPGPAAGPLLETIDELSERIQEYDQRLEHEAQTRYRQTALLTQVVRRGTLTAMAFVLTIEEPHRFRTQPRCGLLPGAAAEAAGLRRPVAAAAHHQGRRQLFCEGTW